eukprot:gene5279-10564_t
MSKPTIRFLRLFGVPLLEQLKYEEMLLRHSADNWCIVCSGPVQPTIVLGLSGQIDKLVDISPVVRDDIPMIRRFSGGGTVVVDSSTAFVTFIANSADVKSQPYPREIMKWTELFYKPVFQQLKSPKDFILRENDYVFDNKKIAGNAQAIVKDRWLHHTSFLWDFNPVNMKYLKMPSKKPDYRGTRDHSDFLTTLQHNMPFATMDDFFEEIFHGLETDFSPQSVVSHSFIAEMKGEMYSTAVTRTTVELPDKYIIEAESKIPSLIRMGPSCFNR